MPYRRYHFAAALIHFRGKIEGLHGSDNFNGPSEGPLDSDRLWEIGTSRTTSGQKKHYREERGDRRQTPKDLHPSLRGRVRFAHGSEALASVHPETLSFWNHWANSDFWGEGPGGFG